MEISSLIYKDIGRTPSPPEPQKQYKSICCTGSCVVLQEAGPASFAATDVSSIGRAITTVLLCSAPISVMV